MITVKNITVRSFDLDHLDIFWQIDDTDENLERYSFYILRSIDGAGGPFNEITGAFDNLYNFRDPDVHLLHQWRTYYYKVRVISKDNGLIQDFGPEWMRAKPDRIALEIQRRMYLVLKEKVGRTALLFPALTCGQRCPTCWDRGRRGNTIGRSTQQNCATCYSTGYLGGFARPVEIYIQVDPTSVTPQLIDQGTMTPVTTTSRTGAFPPVKPLDMIVEAENKRWRVERVPVTEKLRATVHQEPVLRRIPTDDPCYSVPVNLDPQRQFSPSREFTRPMDTGNEPS